MKNRTASTGRALFAAAIAAFLVQYAAAQKPARESLGFYLHFSGQQIQRKVQNSGGEMDFLNHLYDGTGNEVSGVLSFGTSFSAGEKWSFSAGFGTYSDMGISRMNIESEYLAGNISPAAKWGVQTIASIFPVYINPVYPSNHYEIKGIWHGDELIDVNTNYRQFRVYDPGISLIPFISYSHKALNLSAGTGFRLSSFMPFSERIDLKQTGGNLRREIRYATGYRPAIASHTTATASVDLAGKGEFRLGIQAKAALIYGLRTIPYTRSISTWTAGNTTEERIVPAGKPYLIAEAGGGIYLRFGTRRR